MKNWNDEITKLSMADEDDYDEYEEEVIERDEEYDDEDYDDEEYDEEYDDEDYDDEEYEDEGYDEEEPYEEGYDDQYYDDRLNRVLDELAELKRGMAPPAVVPQQQQPIQPQLLYTLPQQNSNEVVMYNEISRLRDELAKTQNEQTLHVELSRMKEEMENQRRQNEAQFLAEIRRLNERIEELQQNPNDAAVALNGGSTASGLLPEPSHNPAGASSKEFSKLLNINETLLRSSRDSSAHILSELAELKSKLAESGDDGELAKAVESIRTAIGESDNNAFAALEEITRAVAELRETLEENGGASGGSIDKKLINKLSRIKSDGAGVDLTEIMRSVYELKGMLGTTDPTQKSLVNMALKVYAELDLLHASIDNAPDFKAKLEAVEKFVAQVNDQDYITSDALDAFRIVLQDIMSTPIDRNVFDAVCSFASATGKITVSSAKKEAVGKCIAFCERIEKEDLDEILEFLPEMISALNDAEGSKNVTSNAGLYDDILDVAVARGEAATDAIKRSAEAEIRALLSELADLRLDDVITYAPPMPLPTSDALTFSDGDSVSDRLDALTEAVNLIGDTVANAAFGSMPLEETDEASADGETAATAEVGSFASEFDRLKNMLAALNAKMNIDELITDIKNNYASVTGRLAAIESKLSAGSRADGEAEYSAEEEAPVYGAEPSSLSADEIVDRISERLEGVVGTQAQVSADEDLAFIKEKLTEQESIISQILDLRADVSALTETMNSTVQFDKLYEDTVAQFDKLYEDLSAVEGDSAEKLAGELAEIKAAVETLSGSDVSSAVLDGIIDLRTTYEETQALGSADREKLLEDLEFVRTQVQNWLDSQSSETVHNEDLLEQISELKESFSANMLALEDKVASLSQDRATDAELTKSLLTAVAERFDEMDTTAMQMATSLDEIKEKSDAIAQAISDNGLLTTENQGMIADSVARILDQLTPAVEEGAEPIESNLFDEIMAIAEKLEDVRAASEQTNQEMLSAIAEVKEQVHLKELEQDLATVSASEEEQKALLSEISELRERLSGLENAQILQNETAESQFTALSDKLNEIALGLTSDEPVATADMEQLLGDVSEIKTMLTSENAQESATAVVEDVKAILDDLAEIKERLSHGEGEDTALDMQLLVADVAEIKERLFAGEETSSEIVKMQDDLTFIRNQIEANIDTMPEDDDIADTLQSEDLSLILDDLAAIKEKLATLDEYDTVAEILSLREDVKSARILDTEDVAAELEALKGDLLELKAELSDMGAVRADTESVVMTGAGPTSDEVNMLLGEIVSLRDEIQAYKDDVSAAMSAQPEGETEPGIAVADESLSVILEELTGLHNDIDSVRGETLAEQADEIESIKTALSEIKDMISRRTTLSEDASQDGTITGELNVVLDEIINVKDEVTALKTDLAVSSETVAAERESDAQAERAAFADMLQTFKNELYAMVSEKLEETGVVPTDMGLELQEVREQLADLQALAVSGTLGEEGAPSSISAELAEIKQLLAERPAAAPAADNETVQALYSEVLALRQDMEAARASQPVVTESGTVDLSAITDQIQALREEMQAFTAPVETTPDVAVLNEILSLREELTEMREQMAAPVQEDTEADNTLLTELLSLREELATIREQMATPVQEDSETDHTLLTELLSLREEIESLRSSRAEDEDVAGLSEAIEAIRADVSAIREEPDLSVVSEMLALRDEFQAFKDELNKSRTASDEAKSREELLAEVQSLRDQLFAISMANVNDGTGSDVVYESYNNIILDEIAALRDEIALLKRADETGALSEDIAQLKDKLANYVIDDGEKSEAAFAEIRGEIARLASDESAAKANRAILSELAELKNELAAQREEEEVTRRAVAELADMIENRLGGSAADKNEQLLEKLDSIKTEIASSVAAPTESADELRDEIESLRAALDRTFGEPVAIDNSAILEEIASLRDEVNRRPADTDGKRILAELAQLKKELAAIADREERDGRDDNDDSSLSQSISDLRAELSHIAGFVDGEDSKSAPKKTATRAKPGPKPKSTAGVAAKSGTRAKPGPKPGSKRTPKKPTMKADNGLSGDELLSKIEAMSREIPEIDDGMMLNPDYVLSPDDIPPTSEEMDIAARLAKQVANKLIMEQLVQQLGDGDVTQNEVEEIVKDILPQEFTTIQIDEQTDRVRRLANSLVLDKLRSRLKK